MADPKENPQDNLPAEDKEDGGLQLNVGKDGVKASIQGVEVKIGPDSFIVGVDDGVAVQRTPQPVTADDDIFIRVGRDLSSITVDDKGAKVNDGGVDAYTAGRIY